VEPRPPRQQRAGRPSWPRHAPLRRRRSSACAGNRARSRKASRSSASHASVHLVRSRGGGRAVCLRMSVTMESLSRDCRVCIRTRPTCAHLLLDIRYPAADLCCATPDAHETSAQPKHRRRARLAHGLREQAKPSSSPQAGSSARRPPWEGRARLQLLQVTDRQVRLGLHQRYQPAQTDGRSHPDGQPADALPRLADTRTPPRQAGRPSRHGSGTGGAQGPQRQPLCEQCDDVRAAARSRACSRRTPKEARGQAPARLLK